jgi:hypothetical protein
MIYTSDGVIISSTHSIICWENPHLSPSPGFVYILNPLYIFVDVASKGCKPKKEHLILE